LTGFLIMGSLSPWLPYTLLIVLPLPLELSLIGMPGCWLRVSPDIGLRATAQGTAKGWFAQPVSIPNLPALRGQRLFAQWLVLDPTHGASTTRALDVTVR